MQLRSELREKEMKLTDIRLEALSSAHQLDQLREAMNRMQVCTHTIEISFKSKRWRIQELHNTEAQTSLDALWPYPMSAPLLRRRGKY